MSSSDEDTKLIVHLTADTYRSSDIVNIVCAPEDVQKVAKWLMRSPDDISRVVLYPSAAEVLYPPVVREEDDSE